MSILLAVMPAAASAASSSNCHCLPVASEDVAVDTPACGDIEYLFDVALLVVTGLE
jgi:hypothetical protein